MCVLQMTDAWLLMVVYLKLTAADGAVELAT